MAVINALAWTVVNILWIITYVIGKRLWFKIQQLIRNPNEGLNLVTSLVPSCFHLLPWLCQHCYSFYWGKHETETALLRYTFFPNKPGYILLNLKLGPWTLFKLKVRHVGPWTLFKLKMRNSGHYTFIRLS